MLESGKNNPSSLEMARVVQCISPARLKCRLIELTCVTDLSFALNLNHAANDIYAVRAEDGIRDETPCGDSHEDHFGSDEWILF